MKYQISITINQPLKVVTKLFANRALLHRWQPELSNSQLIETFPFHKYTHQLDLGRRKMVMTETILRNALPAHLDVKFELKGVTNFLYHSFEAIDATSTSWTCTSEHTFSGIMKLIAYFMKGSLKNQTEMSMHNFKLFAESQ